MPTAKFLSGAVDKVKVNCIVLCVIKDTTAKGFYAIKHHETGKHKSNYLLKKGSNQLHIITGTNNTYNRLHFFSEKDATHAAELIWCLKIIVGNFSACSCQDISSVFQAMFPSEAVATAFSLNATKFSYIATEALAPYFRKNFLNEAQAEFFTLQYDVTFNNAGVKELQTVIRYWSNKEGEIVSHHLKSFYMGHATAEDFKRNILLTVDHASLSLSKLLMLQSDGPRVNQRVLRLINEDVKLIRKKGLVDIGFCNLHVVNNAFQKGLEELGTDASDLIISVYQYFKNWPSRWEDFTEILEEKKIT